MKEVVVLSGKGGTGKTTIVGCFAALARNKVLADCVVDAADLHLLLKPVSQRQNEFWSGQVSFIDEAKCIHCHLCQKQCRFEAIHDFKVVPLSCDGCGLCSHICSAEAISLKETIAGHWFISDTSYGPLVHARLGSGQKYPGELIALVRQQARLLAKERRFDYIISDGPPGIGFAAASSLSGASRALLVTEPTLSGIHGLESVLSLCRRFNVMALVCINKSDLNEDNTRQIERYCLSQKVEVAAKIPFDEVVTEAVIRGVPVPEYSRGRVAQGIESLWQRISQVV